MALDEAVKIMTGAIAAVLAGNAPSVYLCGSVARNDFRLGWSDVDILALTQAPISPEQAATLVNLRQDLLARFPGNPYFRSFEGGMLSLGNFLDKSRGVVVYWGTSGQRVTDNYDFNAVSTREWLDYGKPLFGEDVRGRVARPTFDALVDCVRRHYEDIRKYGGNTGRNLYSFGWLLDVARCLYTLRNDDIIAKTLAGEWALREGVCPVPEALETALAARENPLAALADPAVMDFAEGLGGDVQKFADVLERELLCLSNC